MPVLACNAQVADPALSCTSLAPNPLKKTLTLHAFKRIPSLWGRFSAPLARQDRPLNSQAAKNLH
ncbi:MAG: hypothetical protein K0R12_1391 [Gammaproteobacteria bacterium]|nr:hypothetical protein [Gammaproteobacteria bacterium]